MSIADAYWGPERARLIPLAEVGDVFARWGVTLQELVEGLGRDFKFSDFPEDAPDEDD
jgi:hypothetical protein